MVCILIIFLVSFGGLVRLTRSGLSIVEWNPISGVVPPIGQQAWETEFAKYQQTPEFQIVNKNMTLGEYKEIFYLEWFHRLIARVAGLLVAIPLLIYMLRGYLPWRKSGIYVLIALGFAFQGALGWYMVSSGLIDRPAVSHYRLAFHLLTALALLALTLWTTLKHYYGFPGKAAGAKSSTAYKISVLLITLLILQIAYGALVAGLKAGHASNTWPLMFGYLIPPNLLTIVEPWWQNLLSAATTVHFVHRWFAFAVLIAAIWLYVIAKKQAHSATIHKSVIWLMGLTVVQIVFGISVIWLGVPLWLALLHQFTALGLFIVALFIHFRLMHEPLQARFDAA